MCAIFGIGVQSKHDIKSDSVIKDILERLFLCSMVRGRTASGVVFTSPDEFKVVKTNQPADKFIRLPEFISAEQECVSLFDDSNPFRLVSAIGHCRLKTKGSEMMNVNNHPIVTKKVVGVHNGVIANDEVLFQSYGKLLERNGIVDSEVIFALVDYLSGGRGIQDSIIELAKTLRGSYACAMSHVQQPHIVWLFKNGSPCDVAHFPDVGIVLWSSSIDYIKESIKGYSLGKLEQIDFPSHSGMALDFFRNKFNLFSLEVRKSNAA